MPVLKVYAPSFLRSDPTGLLFFDSLFDLEDEKQYKVFVNRATDPSEKAIVVQFYDETSEKFFAQVCLIEIHGFEITGMSLQLVARFRVCFIARPFSL